MKLTIINHDTKLDDSEEIKITQFQTFRIIKTANTEILISIQEETPNNLVLRIGTSK